MASLETVLWRRNVYAFTGDLDYALPFKFFKYLLAGPSYPPDFVVRLLHCEGSGYL
jgi:hypothetical protein